MLTVIAIFLEILICMIHGIVSGRADVWMNFHQKYPWLSIYIPHLLHMDYAYVGGSVDASSPAITASTRL
jgi:hypothetical protein